MSSVSLLGFTRAKSGLCVVYCLAFSTLAHTSRLMLGGAIPDNQYNSSILVGLRHPVIARHALIYNKKHIKMFQRLQPPVVEFGGSVKRSANWSRPIPSIVLGRHTTW